MALLLSGSPASSAMLPLSVGRNLLSDFEVAHFDLFAGDSTYESSRESKEVAVQTLSVHVLDDEMMRNKLQEAQHMTMVETAARCEATFDAKLEALCEQFTSDLAAKLMAP